MQQKQYTPNGGGKQAATLAAGSVEELGGTNLLDSGLRYGQQGWKIFPVDGKKEPLTPHSFKDATIDPAQIEAWATKWPGANWALDIPGGLLVTDLDVKHGQNGIREFEKLQGCKPEEYAAPRVRTGSGGYHLYMDPTGRDFKNSVGKIASGIDTRTNGGYVLLPSGNGWYRWETSPDTPRPPAPAWTEVALRINGAEYGLLPEGRPYIGVSEYGNILLSSACEAIETAPDKTQEHTLNSRSYVIGHYVAGGLLEYGPTVEKLVAAGMRMINYDEKDKWTEQGRQGVRAKVIHAIRDGMKKPMDGEEIDRAVEEAMRVFSKDPQVQKDTLELIVANEEGKLAEYIAGTYVPDVSAARASRSEKKPEPEPEPESVPKQSPPEEPWPVLREEAMYGLAGDVVRAYDPHTESDPVALLIQLLAYFGNIVGRGSCLYRGKEKFYTNLFALLVGRSSKSRKGTSANLIRGFMSTAAGTDPWATECISPGLSTGEGLIWAVRDPIYKMKGGKQVEEDPGVSDKRHLFDEREFFNTLTVMTRAGNTLSPIMREAWDNRGILRLVTKHSPAKSTGAHISVVGHITEDELRQNLGQSALMNGFANRFVFALVKRSKWLADGGGDIDPAVEHELARRVGAAVAKGRRPMTVVAMTEAAEAEWRSAYVRLEEELPGLLGAACGRSSAQVLSLALIYALLDGSCDLDVVHLRAGLAVWDYCEQSAKHIFGDLLGDKVADTILLALRSAGSVGMSRTELNYLFNKYQTSATIAAALLKLLTCKKANYRKELRSGNLAEVSYAL
jgi:hypothetical protein